MRPLYLLAFLIVFLTGPVVLLAQTAVCLSVLNVGLPNDACTIDIQPQWLNAGSYGVPGGTIAYHVVDGNDLPPGTHTVKLKAWFYSPSGAYIGQNTCWSTVNVQDKINPDVTCHDQTISLVAPDQEYVIVTEDLYTATDNCSVAGQSISVTDYTTGYGTETFSVNVSDPAGNTDNCSGTITTVDGEPQNYCASARNANYEHIANVSLTTSTNTIDVASGNNGGYEHHLPTGENILYHGSTYTLDYEPGFTWGSYHEYWSVYLDKNGDGDFTDAGELLHQWNGYGGNSFSFTSPGTFWGWSRIRVVMRYGSYGGPCGGGGYGETEDISVYLRPRFFIIFPWFSDPAGLAESFASAEVMDPVFSRHNETPAPGEAGRRARDINPSLSAPLTPQRVEPKQPAGLRASAFTVYPNPAVAGTSLNVRGLSAANPAPLELRDVNGGLVANYLVTGEELRVDLPAGIPAGVYLLGREGESRWERVVVR